MLSICQAFPGIAKYWKKTIGRQVSRRSFIGWPNRQRRPATVDFHRWSSRCCWRRRPWKIGNIDSFCALFLGDSYIRWHIIDKSASSKANNIDPSSRSSMPRPIGQPGYWPILFIPHSRHLWIFPWKGVIDKYRVSIWVHSKKTQ